MTRLDNDLISRKALLEEFKWLPKMSGWVSPDDVTNIITNAPTIEADSGEAVEIPTNVEQAKLMALLSTNWLSQNAPSELTSPQKQWVELTDGQIQEIFEVCKDEAIKSKVATNLILNFAKAYLAKLKEVNHG